MPCTVRAPISVPPDVARPQDERGEREDRQSDQEHPPAAEEVGELPAREHENGKGERVGVDRPLELREADAEIALDRRQRHVHDRVVEHDHEEGERERAQRPPPAVLLREDPRAHSAPSARG